MKSNNKHYNNKNNNDKDNKCESCKAWMRLDSLVGHCNTNNIETVKNFNCSGYEKK